MYNPGGPYSADDLAQAARERLSREEAELPARLVRDYLARVLREKPGRGRRKPYTDRVLHKLLCLLQVRDRAPRLALPDLGRVINSLPAEQVAMLAAGEGLNAVPDVEHPDELVQHFRGAEAPSPHMTETTGASTAPASTGAPDSIRPAEPAAATTDPEPPTADLEPLDELFDLLKKDRRPSRSGAPTTDPASGAAPPEGAATPGAQSTSAPAAEMSSSPESGARAVPTSRPAAEGWTSVPTRKGIRLEVAADLTIAQQRQLEVVAELIHEIVTGSG